MEGKRENGGKEEKKRKREKREIGREGERKMERDFHTDFLKSSFKTSGQDGGVGRNGSPLRTTTTKLQLKYRTTIAQNHHKLS